MLKKKVFHRPHLGGAVYILPNALTTGNLFFGFFSVIKSVQGDFKWAAGAILLASVFDVLDGRVARLTKGTSEFGVQYDSLCDLVSFGLAPSFLAFQYSLNQMGRFGWIICFIYVACCALRLARFNVQSSIGKADGDFIGLPVPMAAGVVSCLIAYIEDVDEIFKNDFWFLKEVHDFFLSTFVQNTFLAIYLPILSILMVSNVTYRSHKSFNFKNIKPFRLLALFVVIIGLVGYKPALMGFLIFFLYSMSGMVEFILGWKKAADEDEIFEPIDDHPPHDSDPKEK